MYVDVDVGQAAARWGMPKKGNKRSIMNVSFHQTTLNGLFTQDSKFRTQNLVSYPGRVDKREIKASTISIQVQYGYHHNFALDDLSDERMSQYPLLAKGNMPKSICLKSSLKVLHLQQLVLLPLTQSPCHWCLQSPND